MMVFLMFTPDMFTSFGLFVFWLNSQKFFEISLIYSYSCVIQISIGYASYAHDVLYIIIYFDYFYAIDFVHRFSCYTMLYRVFVIKMIKVEMRHNWLKSFVRLWIWTDEAVISQSGMYSLIQIISQNPFLAINNYSSLCLTTLYE